MQYFTQNTHFTFACCIFKLEIRKVGHFGKQKDNTLLFHSGLEKRFYLKQATKPSIQIEKPKLRCQS